MWRDIGLGDWLFDFDNEGDVRRLPSAVLAMDTNPVESIANAAKARQYVHQRPREAWND
ncbi:hypothetical protein [Stieleria varia]|uniref:Uncharacterized protein n=1 Tax=Stieleria varia TaxID=2528005 RepID=A0A5C6A075_9BACT|nr:hypothetical protein [Stieleria varia]TWT92691.1 hypothetical protein Pla52n_60560 [Stieleria varia]